MCVPMAQTLKRNIFIPEYRLAPQYPFPAALEDALKSYRWLLAQGFRPADIVIIGDSAGGGLALATVLALRDAHEPLPTAVVCMSAWADLTHKGKSHSVNARSEVVLRTDVLQEWALYYTDASNLNNPLVSPVYGDFHGFPPLLLQVGSNEILLDDSMTVAQKAKAVGVDVTLKVWDDMWHVWPALGDLIPESRGAFIEMEQFIRDH
jgi:epsilon-lactone hydrolase